MKWQKCIDITLNNRDIRKTFTDVHTIGYSYWCENSTIHGGSEADLKSCAGGKTFSLVVSESFGTERFPTQPAVTSLKLTIETLEQGVKYV